MTAEIAPATTNQNKANNFLRQRIADDLETGTTKRVVTRFPPEPNGYLHIGHAKSICINFGLAEAFGGHCHLRFDDTNPEKESQEYIDAIIDDLHWLGFQWHGDTRFASDYFEQLHQWAKLLIGKNLAYVCDLSPEQARAYRGSLTEAGRNSPYRERSADENLALFEKMTAGEFDEGHCVLRAKIDMSAPNINLRDPIIYRIRKFRHHRTANKWCVYPTYDFTHGQSDAIEGITHSICTLEFEDHRPLYEWFLQQLPVPNQPRQFEFSRLNVNYTVTSKRKLKHLVDAGLVDGWDDPRMPTISGMRRRGYAAQSLRNFCDSTGVTRVNGVVDMSQLEFAVREHHNVNAPRAMVVMQPLKIVLGNYDASDAEQLRAPNHPQNEAMGSRSLPFGRELYIDREDFRESANKKFKRLVLGKKVRLRNAYVIFAESVVRDEQGEIVEVHCSYDPATLGADPPDGVKPKGVIQWVSAAHAVGIEVREYDRLFRIENPERAGSDEQALLESVNPNSLRVHRNCLAEPSLAEARPEQVFQFEREGYFVADRHQHTSAKPVFNKTIGLRDSWGKVDNQASSSGAK
ncbi:MAG: glutamine--tRNA ligase/YqeY domain fusion protein [Gammaproteobacteria bacterium]|nr:glutamine--tRNA ligase/YqeY domain fusion protein [Gammaproteobacteria bacterium]